MSEWVTRPPVPSSDRWFAFGVPLLATIGLIIAATILYPAPVGTYLALLLFYPAIVLPFLWTAFLLQIRQGRVYGVRTTYGGIELVMIHSRKVETVDWDEIQEIVESPTTGLCRMVFGGHRTGGKLRSVWITPTQADLVLDDPSCPLVT